MFVTDAPAMTPALVRTSSLPDDGRDLVAELVLVRTQWVRARDKRPYIVGCFTTETSAAAVA